MSNVGFIGLGIMGKPMAEHLQAGGHQLHLAQLRTPVPKEFLDQGAIICESAKAVAEQRIVADRLIRGTAAWRSSARVVCDRYDVFVQKDMPAWLIISTWPP